jgi:hypothetical protein
MLEGYDQTQLEWREEFGRSGLFRSCRHDGERLQLKIEEEAVAGDTLPRSHNKVKQVDTIASGTLRWSWSLGYRCYQGGA